MGKKVEFPRQITVKVRPGREGDLAALAAKELGVGKKEIQSLRVIKRSVDARDKEAVRLVYCLEINGGGEMPSYAPAKRALKSRPVVVGCGPAGLFAAYILCLSGNPPILLERGGDMDSRVAAVERFESTGILDCSTNIQFGEGGAGTFSDGKLNTGIKSPFLPFVLQTLHKFGAPEEILYTANPHAGTDRLRAAVKNMRLELEKMGCEVRFNTCVTDIITRNGALWALVTDRGEIPCQTALFAMGHSARDTFEMLLARGLSMEKKPFSLGARIEHLQADMDAANYGRFAGHPSLPVSSYKLSTRAAGRGVYSFCVCPGGQVVAAASEEGGVVTNGMSFFARDGENINGAILVSVTPEDFDPHPLAGMYFQRELERKAFALGGGNYFAPAQTLGDFLKTGGEKGRLSPTYRPGVKECDLHSLFPEHISRAMAEGIAAFGRKIPGFDAPHVWLTGPETRSSSPVKMHRGGDFLSNISGLYPCGEGAGWAGGIMSAAIDGIKVAEAILDA
ncbi:MAG: hypothetical protein IJP23_03525 [Oscillospiraceae bacterium]|nr:hypothetical protein [Oscillospiraceae bacterium]